MPKAIMHLDRFESKMANNAYEVSCAINTFWAFLQDAAGAIENKDASEEPK